MKGETLIRVVEVPRSEPRWPDFWIVTDRFAYEYLVTRFMRHNSPPKGRDLPIPCGFKGHRIEQVLGDSEDATIVLANGYMVVVGLDHFLFNNKIEGFHSVRFFTPEESDSWRHELEDLESLDCV